VLLTLRGTPFLYCGEEIGMTDGPVPPEQARDPDGRDACRTPMQWNGSSGAGFSAGNPWLPIPATAATVNVADQLTDPGSLLSFYRELIHLRRGTRPFPADVSVRPQRYLPARHIHHPLTRGGPTNGVRSELRPLHLRLLEATISRLTRLAHGGSLAQRDRFAKAEVVMLRCRAVSA
jgi:hypothetical protein